MKNTAPCIILILLWRFMMLYAKHFENPTCSEFQVWKALRMSKERHRSSRSRKKTHGAGTRMQHDLWSDERPNEESNDNLMDQESIRTIRKNNMGTTSRNGRRTTHRFDLVL
ncbi:hypothetical protein DMN91_011384 [Ooceraea biroi]|uniref:Secreted protein n=1 Tax=Ooceraea biroi TaxID=2015173 RepID=A0A3L8D638_OOCBI|nr:hypothetical protein DMN91_011379 [Ooceraea biroi]RLU15631.1 hypothetical protein DMN91_011384 [Ooceraea biroi]